MPAKPITLQFFCQTKIDNAGRPDEARTDITLAPLRIGHLKHKEGEPAPADPNPGVFANDNSGGTCVFADVTDTFAAQFKRGKKYEMVLREID